MIILVHGLASAGSELHFQLDALAARGYPARSFDVMGHAGGYRPAPGEGYSPAALDADFARNIAALAGDDPIDLLGHSLGAYLSLRYALASPERVHRLVLISPLISPRQLRPHLRLVYRYPRLASAVSGWAPAWLIERLIRLDRENAGGRLAGSTVLMAENFKRMDGRFLSLGPLEDLSPALAALPCPALFIIGERDDTLGFASIRRLAGQAPGAKLVRVAGGHNIHLSHPEEVNRAILEFLAN